MAFNEDTRVKIPAILTLTRLGYKYLSLKSAKWDIETNIFTDIFKDSIRKINNNVEDEDIDKLYKDISLMLDYEDLGKAFYERLTSSSGINLIDFENFSNNEFHVVTELTCKNGDDEFRPDITILINGMPLCFIEVKKPNNREGVLAERDRINVRFKNKKFRKFINISQILMFSNNMEYDDESIVPIQGAYYSSTSTSKAFFNCFKEERPEELRFIMDSEKQDTENFILKDNNQPTLKNSPEFITNKNENTPTNRLIISLFSKERLKQFLKYAIAYVETEKGLEKHIMRYPQFFASKAIQDELEKGTKKGIIWHTQGSGKTALSFYNVNWLTQYYAKKKIIPKFYFIVDRLDLRNQACREFTSRGLKVHTVNSREDFVTDIKNPASISNDSGKNEITVINIQKFSEDSKAATSSDYNIQTQRIYFIDEAHRSYDPKGSFLVNLVNSDPNAIFISLTGTPLIGKKKSTTIWGDYIHKYYYNASIADGYTLRLMRENIETKYKLQMQDILQKITIKEGDIDDKQIYAHKRFVEPMLDYIVDDLTSSRIMHNDSTLGGMVVCHSSGQAKMLQEFFEHKYKNNPDSAIKTSALILHDIGTKEDRKDEVDDFKACNIDLLFVYNMLLTGFDAPRLKKLYLNREVKAHNLLQTLTRVNRPYKGFKYGYVVDFADIKKEFDKANKAYWDELQGELGDEIDSYSNLFKSADEIEQEIEEIKETLWNYTTTNSEVFSQEISQISDKTELLSIRKALQTAKELYNLIRYTQNDDNSLKYEDLIRKIDFRKFRELLREVENHIILINRKEAIEKGIDTTQLLNVAMEDALFTFRKLSEAELILADELKNVLRRTREGLGGCFDKKDPAWISLKDELERLFKKKNLDEITQDEMKQNIDILNDIYDKIKELNRKNDLLKAKYNNDKKYARVHKRIMQERSLNQKESKICDVLNDVKEQTDEKVLQNDNVLESDSYFAKMVLRLVFTEFKKRNIDLDAESAKYISNQLTREYLNEYKGQCA
ncbi:MAG: DEAD/DEAH box helicase family protein [Candidatus Gastranaerophilales bacterium]|nr:DEAD/DEAH box helicase family protein [Candidatus Gastranaerophilales bacterium]